MMRVKGTEGGQKKAFDVITHIIPSLPPHTFNIQDKMILRLFHSERAERERWGRK